MAGLKRRSGGRRSQRRTVYAVGCLRCYRVGLGLLVALLPSFSWWLARAGAQPSPSPPPPPSGKELAEQLLARAGDGFRIYETDHFVIGYDTSVEHLLPLVGRLEGTFDAVWRFAEKSGIKVTPPTRRLRVLFFEHQADYAKQAYEVNVDPVAVAGFYSAEEDVAVFSNTLTRPAIQGMTDEMDKLAGRVRSTKETGRRTAAQRRHRRELSRRVSSLKAQRDRLVERFNQLVIQHEASHQVFFHIGVHRVGGNHPPWLAEGLACQFEIPQAHADGRLMTVNHMRLADFRDALGVDRTTTQLRGEAYRSAIRSPTWVSLREFVRDPARFHERGADLRHRYGQAWGLVYFLGRKHIEVFAEYVSTQAHPASKDPETFEQRLAAFESAFGPVDEIERAWIAFMLPLRVDWQPAGR